MSVFILDRRIKPAAWAFERCEVDPQWSLFWKSTQFFFPFWEGSEEPSDIVERRPTSFSGDDPVWDYGPMGRRLTAHASGSQVNLTEELTDLLGGDDFFIASLFSSAATTSGKVVVTSGNSLVHNLGLHRGSTPDNIYGRAFGNQIDTSANFFSAGDILLALFSTAGPSGAMTLEARNLTALKRQRVTGTAGTSTLDATYTVRMFRRATNVYELSGSIYWVALGRGLPTGSGLTVLADRLAADPFGPIRSARLDLGHRVGADFIPKIVMVA